MSWVLGAHQNQCYSQFTHQQRPHMESSGESNPLDMSLVLTNWTKIIGGGCVAVDMADKCGRCGQNCGGGWLKYLDVVAQITVADRFLKPW